MCRSPVVRVLAPWAIAGTLEYHRGVVRVYLVADWRVANRAATRQDETCGLQFLVSHASRSSSRLWSLYARSNIPPVVHASQPIPVASATRTRPAMMAAQVMWLHPFASLRIGGGLLRPLRFLRNRSHHISRTDEPKQSKSNTARSQHLLHLRTSMSAHTLGMAPALFLA